MPTLLEQKMLERTIAPTEEEKRLASRTSQKLGMLKLDRLNLPFHDIRVQIPDEHGSRREQPGAEPPEEGHSDEGCSGVALSIPTSALMLLNEILKEMARGNAVTVVPVQAMLTTQQAANILNVSRPFVVGLLESGKIPYQKLGSHRRVRFEDLMTFKKKADTSCEQALRELQEEAQDLGPGY